MNFPLIRGIEGVPLIDPCILLIIRFWSPSNGVVNYLAETPNLFVVKPLEDSQVIVMPEITSFLALLYLSPLITITLLLK
jgi:hypothetical protein